VVRISRPGEDRPATAVKRLNAALRTRLARPTSKKRLLEFGADTGGKHAGGIRHLPGRGDCQVGKVVREANLQQES